MDTAYPNKKTPQIFNLKPKSVNIVDNADFLHFIGNNFLIRSSL